MDVPKALHVAARDIPSPVSPKAQAVLECWAR